MRIVNRHFSNLLEGYDRIVEYHRQFETVLAREGDRLRKMNAQTDDAYHFQLLQHSQEVQRRQELYQHAYTAWLASERPTRQAYERKLVEWRKRLEHIVGGMDTRLAKERASLGNSEAFFWFAVAASFLIVTIPLAVPAAVWLYLKNKARRAQLAALLARRNTVHATPEPPYKPLTPAPRRPVAPQEPNKPKHAPIPSYSNMLDYWWSCLFRPPGWLKNEEVQRDGDAGEEKLMDAMAEALDDSFIAIPGAKLERGLDGDVIVIGANGVWVFDSKYLSGEVRYNGRTWSHRKLIHTKGGRGAREWIDKPISDLCDEWMREYQSVDYTLKKNMRRPFPPVVGGLAFTLDSVDLEIDDSCDVAWGPIDYWVDRVTQVPLDLRYTERDLVECAHHILNFSHRMEGDDAASAYDMAETVYSQFSSELQQFKAKNQLI